jgi:hypothetical protein
VDPPLPDSVPYRHVGQLRQIVIIGNEKDDNTVIKKLSSEPPVVDLSLQDHNTNLYGWRIYRNFVSDEVRARVGTYPMKPPTDTEWGASLTAAGAAAFMTHVGYPVLAVAEVLLGLEPGTATRILHNLGFKAVAIATALQQKFGKLADKTAELLHVFFDGTEVGRAMKEVFGKPDEWVAAKLKGLGESATTVARALNTVFGRLSAKVTEILHKVGYLPVKVATALQNVFDKTAKPAAELLDDFFDATQVGLALKEVYGKTAGPAAEILKDVGFGAVAIAKAMKVTFLKKLAGVASILKDLFGLAGITNVIKGLLDGFKAKAEDIVPVLVNIGFNLPAILATIAGLT